MSIFSRLLGARRGAPLPYPPGAPPGLAARWVRWVAGVENSRNPVRDRTGAHAGINQPDDVWFLAGTFGGRVERRCTVRAGRPLFFPAFNMWHGNAQGPPPAVARAFGALTVNAVPVELDTIATPVPFVVAGARLNPVTGTRGPVRMTVWGLWKRLEPLPPGDHVLEFSGGDGHGFTASAVYHLNVAR
ncbi:hypothetical protein [Dactylosporangium sp. CA-139066]|uniref:hypothetical protein n=1 Tax=Dactylosporangium sp. CA-139066 TaxID=3239930 RepID=UPI003D94DAE0